MDVRQFAEQVVLNLPYDPTDQQMLLVGALSRFCSSHTPSDSVFLLNGYAGTGKTSLCASLVKTLNSIGIKTVLLAPTGRAAKVFSAFAHHPAYTFHRRIYTSGGNGITTPRAMKLAENRATNTLFIVDEASMIGADDMSGNLLENLIHYVYSGVNCRLILLGDTAQLPPVGCEESPAMNVEVLKSYGLHVTRAIMTETVRQGRESGILYNATRLRRAMRLEQLPAPRLLISPFDDVLSLSGEYLAESLGDAYGRDGVGQTILITRSNKRATDFNLAIRSNILYREEELCRDELLLVAKNNYFWSKEVKGLDFIANGDVAVVVKVYGTERRYGCRFADVKLYLPDRDVELDCKIMLDTLVSESASMSREDMTSLFESIIKDPLDEETSDATRAANALKSPYFNALQVKYGYAVTCHKAQGGQWRNVYVDMGHIPAEAMGMDFYRWLYTATTRATHTLYYVNPTIELS